MKTSKLPPELVENIDGLIRKTIIESSPINTCASEIAQIAVEHTNENVVFAVAELAQKQKNNT